MGETFLNEKLHQPADSPHVRAPELRAAGMGMRWEVRVARDGWSESIFAPTVEEALAGIDELREYPRVAILYVDDHETGERWNLLNLAWSFPGRDHADRPTVGMNRIIEPGDVRTFVIDVHGKAVQYLWSGSDGLLAATCLRWEGSHPDTIEMRQPVMVISPGGGRIPLTIQHHPDDGDSDIAALCLKATEGHLARLSTQQRPQQR